VAEIDWTDLSSKITPHFTVKEAIWLPQENRAASGEELTEEIKANLIETFNWLEKVRVWIGLPIIVTIALRTLKYHLALYERINAKNRAEGKPEVRVPMGSKHLNGTAVDFQVARMSCDDVRKKILDEKKLEEWNLRMENNGEGSNWVHLDSGKPGPSGRYFKP